MREKEKDRRRRTRTKRMRKMRKTRRTRRRRKERRGEGVESKVITIVLLSPEAVYTTTAPGTIPT